MSHGIVDEVYYPRVDQACTRDLGLLLSDGADLFVEEKRDATSTVSWLEPGVPGFVLDNRLPGNRRIRKTVLTDPERDVLLQHVELDLGDRSDLHLTVLLAPHLGNRGGDNEAWIGDFKGVPMLFAGSRGRSLALASDAPWIIRSVGYVGASDAWQDVSRNGRMTWAYEHAGPGNVALAGEIDLAGCGDAFTLALGFGITPAEAGQRARQALQEGFERARLGYVTEWNEWSAGLETEGDVDDLSVASRAVLRVHESTSFAGGIIASLSIPWGFARGDDDIGGYHLVWPRDLVESMGGLLAAGATVDALRCLAYLRATQEGDGHWPQNMWLDGSAYWGGVQMDETALPILAVDLARRCGCPVDDAVYWPMVAVAASFLVANGPVTGQDRWEEDAGYSPFTLAAEIAALLCAADMADRVGDSAAAGLFRDTADAWNERVEHWTYVAGTDLAAEVGVDGYYVRVAAPDTAEAATPATGWVPIKNRPPGESGAPAAEIVSPDALALVRFGLRAADDPRILNTIAVIDHELRVDLPQGPAWHRYSQDGYGEHRDGSPFDGVGIGRAWPLLTGERAHHAVAAGDTAAATELADAMRRFAGDGLMLPEQVWDAAEVDAWELHPGRPSGSAMPLAWAHAEYLKVRRSLRDGAVFDMPPQTRRRYVVDATPARHVIWSRNERCRTMPAGRILRIHLPAPGVVHWSTDGWGTTHDTPSEAILAVHLADLPTADLPPGTDVVFTLRVDGDWEGTDHRVRLVNGS